MNFDPRQLYYPACLFLVVVSVLFMVRNCKRDLNSHAYGASDGWQTGRVLR